MSSWCPNNSDIGNISTIEFDESGNEYNGTKVGVISQMDSPIGVGSYNFSSNGYVHRIPTILTTDNKNFSISFWTKFDNTSSTMCIYNNRTSTDSGIAVFYIEGKIRFDDGNDTEGHNHQWTTSKSFVKDTWYYICLTRSSTKKKMYIDGILVDETSDVGGLLHIGTQYASIGSSSTNGNAGSSNMFRGNMTDFRIYCSELTAEDVRQMYFSKAKIDKNGNSFCNEFIERDNLQPLLTKTSTLQSQSFIDGYQQLEYISKSEASQRSYYFDLDLYATDIKRIEADISFDAVAQSGGSYFFGGYFGSQTDGRASYNAYLYVAKDTNKIGYGCGGDWISSGMVWNLGDRHYIKSQLFSGSQFLEVDGNRILTHTFSHLPPNTSTVPLLIYQYQGNRLANYGWSGKIYSMKIYGNDEKLIRNLIPCCRKSDNQEGLYDMVNNVFYTNGVTGNFSKGEDISKARIFSNSIIANEIIEI